MASQMSQTVSTSAPRREIYPSTVIGAYTKKGLYISDIHKQLLYNKNFAPLWNYLQGKHNWTEEGMKMINWKALHSAIKTYPPTYAARIAQMMHDWQATGDRKLLMNEGEETCPMQCGQIETKMHYLWCTDESFQKTF